MNTRSLECIVWCPRCREDRYEVYREQDQSNPNVFQNTMIPWPPDGVAPTKCACGCQLERKP